MLFLEKFRGAGRPKKPDHSGHSAARNVELIRDLHLALLKREPEPESLTAMADALTSGDIDRRGVIEAILEADDHARRQAAIPQHRVSGVMPYEVLGCLPSEVEHVCRNFKPYKGAGRDGYLTNFLGGLTDIGVDAVISGYSGVVEDYPILGNFHGDALEWLGTLRAALDAGERFAMIELGAGWAPWCVVGYRAAKQRAIDDITLIAVEGDAGHVGFLRENFAVNQIPDDCANIVSGVVGPTDGTAKFPRAHQPNAVYGGMAAWPGHEAATLAFDQLMGAYGAIFAEVDEVPCHSLDTLSSGLDVIDLVHCDIQGSEAMLFESAIDLVSRKVKRVVVGTHSIEIDRRLLNLFAKAGWEIEGVHPCGMGEANGQPVLLVDGTQVWRNPRL
jgi:FkbM family methyltransferase